MHSHHRKEYYKSKLSFIFLQLKISGSVKVSWTHMATCSSAKSVSQHSQAYTQNVSKGNGSSSSR